MNIALVGLHEVDAVWPHLSKGMQRACDRCAEWDELNLSAGLLWQMCRSGNAFLIIAYHEPFKIIMGSVWRFEDQPTVFKCLMVWANARLEWFAPTREFVRKLARENGASSLAATGRKGWLKFAQPSENYDLEEPL